jgi:nicotinamide mononucleotide transporter
MAEGALQFFDYLALIAGVAYAVLAARRNRLCWAAGAVSSACAAVSAGFGKLPMQAGLQVFYVGMAAYGWWSWSRHSAGGELEITLWPFSWHLAAAVACTALALTSAYWLNKGDSADWPLLDSLTTWFSVFATWLAARGKLENWLYWVVINSVMIFLFHQQGLNGLALLHALLVVIAFAGFAGWRRRFRAQAVPA